MKNYLRVIITCIIFPMIFMTLVKDKFQCSFDICSDHVLRDLGKGTIATESTNYESGMKQSQDMEILDLNPIPVISFILKFKIHTIVSLE